MFKTLCEQSSSAPGGGDLPYTIHLFFHSQKAGVTRCLKHL